MHSLFKSVGRSSQQVLRQQLSLAPAMQSRIFSTRAGPQSG